MAEYEKLVERFKNDRFAYLNGIRIEKVTEGDAVCTVEIEDRHLNAVNSVQGGLIFTLGDFAFAVASNCGGKTVVSVNNDIAFIRGTRGSKLFAHAVECSASKRLCFYDVEITDDHDVLVATMSVTGYIKGEAAGKNLP